MSDNKLPDVSSSHSEGEIKVPTMSNVGAPVSDKDLTKLQDSYLSKIAKKEVTTEPTPPPAKTPKPKTPKDAAAEFSKKIKEAAGKEVIDNSEGEGETFRAPQVTEIYKLLEDQNIADDDTELKDDLDDSDESDEGLNDGGLQRKQSDEAIKDSKTENIKNLRTSNTALKNEVAELRRQLEQRGDSSALQSKVNTLQSRIKELEQYELVFGLHNNPEFRREFIDGENTLLSEMNAIATDYDVDLSLIEDILYADSRRDEDFLVANAFPSDESRRDVKTLKRKIEALRKKRAQVEKAPKESLEKLYSKEEETKAERNARRDQHYKRVTNDAWAKAIAQNRSLPDDQQIGELVEIPGMKNHNEKVVRPTLQAASNLANTGLAHIERMIRNQAVIDEPFAAWFMNMCQQASATQMLHSTRKTIYERLQEATAEQQKQRSYDRPGLSPASRTTSVNGGKKKKDGKQIAADIFMEVQRGS